jgi:hypothetical protein
MTHLTVRQAGAAHHIATVSAGKKTLTVATQSFANQMSHAFAETLSEVRSDPNNGKQTTAETASQINVARQNSVTASNPAVKAPVGFNALVPPTNTTPPPTPPPTSPLTAPQSADDGYWAQQPTAVQQLRNIGDYGQRSQMAGQLAAQGYSIDTPVMVWGWDASQTTQLRQSFGYTWVPSAMQAPVTAAPGINGGAITPYNPLKPPPGSIPV